MSELVELWQCRTFVVATLFGAAFDYWGASAWLLLVLAVGPFAFVQRQDPALNVAPRRRLLHIATDDPTTVGNDDGLERARSE